MDKIAKKLDYSQWYFGHYHDNIQYIDAQLLYEEIKELGEPDSVQKVGRPRYRVGEMVYFTFGKEDAREGYGTVEWVDDHGTLGQEKEVSYENRKYRVLMRWKLLELRGRKDRCIFILQVIHIGALIVLKIFAMDMKLQQRM